MFKYYNLILDTHQQPKPSNFIKLNIKPNHSIPNASFHTKLKKLFVHLSPSNHHTNSAPSPPRRNRTYSLDSCLFKQRPLNPLTVCSGPEKSIPAGLSSLSLFPIPSLPSSCLLARTKTGLIRAALWARFRKCVSLCLSGKCTYTSICMHKSVRVTLCRLRQYSAHRCYSFA